MPLTVATFSAMGHTLLTTAHHRARLAALEVGALLLAWGLDVPVISAPATPDGKPPPRVDPYDVRLHGETVADPAPPEPVYLGARPLHLAVDGYVVCGTAKEPWTLDRGIFDRAAAACAMCRARTGEPCCYCGAREAPHSFYHYGERHRLCERCYNNVGADVLVRSIDARTRPS